jgi:hypothetical protein
LKQGELPGQFFLEYYTDNSCRKRKGMIDLDQVEQVDAGLSLDRTNVKYQWMFDMKTPNRTYYLAADTEQDMRDWVMVICQVCNLQETEEKNSANESQPPTAQCKFLDIFFNHHEKILMKFFLCVTIFRLQHRSECRF